MSGNDTSRKKGRKEGRKEGRKRESKVVCKRVREIVRGKSNEANIII